MSMPLFSVQGALLLGAGLLAGAVNAIAGGGSLLTFAALVLGGVSPLHANATSSMALLPGSLSALWGFRDKLVRRDHLTLLICVPSLLGGLLGALLLMRAGEARFARLCPWLLLGAIVLFICKEPVLTRLGRRPDSAPGSGALLALFVLQLGISIYGGFFGSGMGILMLAAFGLAGLTDIHQMNALKQVAALCINGLAACLFASYGYIEWGPALLLAGAAIVGGYGGARVALWIGPRRVWWAVFVINVVLTAAISWRILSRRM